MQSERTVSVRRQSAIAVLLYPIANKDEGNESCDRLDMTGQESQTCFTELQLA